jgi:hypothetical protein
MEDHLRRILLLVVLEVVDVVALLRLTTTTTGVLHEDVTDDSGRIIHGQG